MPQSRAQKRNETTLEATPYDNLVCFNMYRGWRAIQEFYASAFPDNFSAQRSYVMGLCMDKPTTISHIAAVLQIDDAAVSNLIRRMENDKLVKRKRSVEDGRSFQIHATTYGKKITKEVEEKIAILDKKLYSRISENEIAVLYNIVKVIHE